MKSFVYCALLAALGVTAWTQGGTAPTAADWEWLEDSGRQALDTLMPMHLPDGLVTYRSSRDLDVLERYFAIRADFAGDIDSFKATVVLATERPILRQILDIHLKDPGTPMESFQSRLTFKRLTLASGSCPALRLQMDKLPKISISIPARDMISLHPVVHRFVLDFADRIEAKVTDEKSPLVNWATQTMDALLPCSNRGAHLN